VPALSQLSPSRSLPSSSTGWQRDNIVVSLRFDYTDAEYNGANSSMLAAIVLTFICLALQVRKWRTGDRHPPPPPACPPALLSLTVLVQAVGFFGGFTMFDVSLALLRESPPSHSSPRACSASGRHDRPRRRRLLLSCLRVHSALLHRHPEVALRHHLVRLRLLQVRRGPAPLAQRTSTHV
jgi:hypothetical protein